MTILLQVFLNSEMKKVTRRRSREQEEVAIGMFPTQGPSWGYFESQFLTSSSQVCQLLTLFPAKRLQNRPQNPKPVPWDTKSLTTCFGRVFPFAQREVQDMHAGWPDNERSCF